MRVVCISDTHGLHEELAAAVGIPPGDVFVHAGDFTDTGDRDEVLAFNEFLGRLPHKYKLVIAGNHESTFDRAFYPAHWQHYGHRQQYDPDEVRALLTNALYLEDAAVRIGGFLFYGTPWQPEFCSWAFNLPRGDALVRQWRRIPGDVDVLITHTPPLGRGDQVGHLRVGCADLLDEVQRRVRPRFHVFGHVHEGYGTTSDGTTTFVNASSCTHEYEAVNPAIVLDLETPRASATTTKTYEQLLHEQLRICSQKPPFVPSPMATATTTAAADRRRRCSLREFRLEGTTAELLFESTLKLRPVVGEQTRALRYLFHRGFKTNGLPPLPAGVTGGLDGSDDAGRESPPLSSPTRRGSVPEESTNHKHDDDDGAPAAPGTTTLDGHQATPVTMSAREARRRASLLSRRVTVAVLKDLEEKEHVESDETFHPEAMLPAMNRSLPSTTTPDSASGDPSAALGNARARPRRDKTLQRREAVAKLATMIEEPDEKDTPEGSTTASTAPPSAPSPSDATVSSVPPAAATKTEIVETKTTAVTVTTLVKAVPHPECTLCKFKVPGHVHGGSAPQVRVDPPAEQQQVTTIASTTVTKRIETDLSAAPNEVPVQPPPSRPCESTVARPASETTPSPPLPPPAAAADCIMCKYKVSGHVHPGAEPCGVSVEEPEEPVAAGVVTVETTTTTTTTTTVTRTTVIEPEDKAEEDTRAERSRNMARCNRLSSWF